MFFFLCAKASPPSRSGFVKWRTLLASNRTPTVREGMLRRTAQVTNHPVKVLVISVAQGALPLVARIVSRAQIQEGGASALAIAEAGFHKAGFLKNAA